MPDKTSPEDLKHLMTDHLIALTERQQKILSMRYNKEAQKQQTLQQIANTYGLTRERIRQIIARCIMKMRRHKEMQNPKIR